MQEKEIQLIFDPGKNSFTEYRTVYRNEQSAVGIIQVPSGVTHAVYNSLIRP